MRKKSLSSLLSLILVGCSSTSGTRTVTHILPGQTNAVTDTLVIKNYRSFWKTTNMKASVTDENGFKFGLSLGSSSTDSDAITALGTQIVNAFNAGKGAVATGAMGVTKEQEAK